MCLKTPKINLITPAVIITAAVIITHFYFHPVNIFAQEIEPSNVNYIDSINIVEYYDGDYNQEQKSSDPQSILSGIPVEPQATTPTGQICPPEVEDCPFDSTRPDDINGNGQTISSGSFTPDGAGQLIDSILDGGIEFITITTASGNNFFLIIDRNSIENNVHFLSPVTEWHLMALALDETALTGTGASTPSTAPSAIGSYGGGIPANLPQSQSRDQQQSQPEIDMAAIAALITTMQQPAQTEQLAQAAQNTQAAQDPNSSTSTPQGSSGARWPIILMMFGMPTAFALIMVRSRIMKKRRKQAILNSSNAIDGTDGGSSHNDEYDFDNNVFGNNMGGENDEFGFEQDHDGGFDDEANETDQYIEDDKGDNDCDHNVDDKEDVEDAEEVFGEGDFI